MSAGELQAALTSVAYWKQLANDRYEQTRQLTAERDEARRVCRRQEETALLPPPPGMPPTESFDRANARAMQDENVRLRQALEDAHIRCVELAAELQAVKGNPS